MKNFLMETFPNYTEEMYNGNEPNYYIDGINGKIAHYSCKYGIGEIDSNGELIYSTISLDKLNNIYIIGKWIKFIHIPYDGIPHAWGWNNEIGYFKEGSGKDCTPDYPKEYILKLLNKKRDYCSTILYEKTKEKFLEVFNNGDILL